MDAALDTLPCDPEPLRAIIAAQSAELRLQGTLIEKLKAELAALCRARFGASSEKIDRAIAQLELALEDIEVTEAQGRPDDTGPIQHDQGQAFAPAPAGSPATRDDHS